MHEWMRHFENLGMTGETLALALERKERSLLLQSKADSQLAGLQNKTSGHKSKNLKKAMSVLEIMANPPPPPKGWNSFAGTMVIESTNR